MEVSGEGKIKLVEKFELPDKKDATKIVPLWRYYIQAGEESLFVCVSKTNFADFIDKSALFIFNLSNFRNSASVRLVDVLPKDTKS